jgi:adenosylhomocysteinase
MILDDGGDATLLVHKGVEYEKTGVVPTVDDDDLSVSEEYRVILDTLRRALAEDPQRWTRVASDIRGVTEETTTGVHRLYQLAEQGSCCSRRSTSTTRSPRASSTTSTASGTR